MDQIEFLIFWLLDHSFLISIFFVEILKVSFVGNVWFDRWLYFHVFQILPIYVFEPLVLLYFFYSIASNSFIWVLNQTFLNQILQLIRNLYHFRKKRIDRNNPIQHLILIFVVKRRNPIYHFIQ